MFGLGSDAEIIESITIENTGSTNLYINSFHNDIIECKSFNCLDRLVSSPWIMTVHFNPWPSTLEGSIISIYFR